MPVGGADEEIWGVWLAIGCEEIIASWCKTLKWLKTTHCGWMWI